MLRTASSSLSALASERHNARPNATNRASFGMLRLTFCILRFSMTRRTCMSMFAAPLLARAQMSSRGVTPTPRAKASGLPFNAWLTDVAAKAGLTSPVIYGGVDRNDYIVEAIGCGAAFLDYDNDGWLDILLLSGTRWEGAPSDTTNRLYH